MPRIRYIKPSFFDNETLASLPMAARLLFIGLWCYADREGRLEDRPARIKKELLGYDRANVDDLLAALATNGFIIRYTPNDVPLIQIVNFDRHQKPHVKEPASTYPAPTQQHAEHPPSTPPAARGMGNGERGTGNGDRKAHTTVDRSTRASAEKAQPVGVGVGKPQRRDRRREVATGDSLRRDGTDLSMEELRGPPFDIVAACDTYLGRCLWDWFPMLDEMKREYQPEELQHAFEEARRRRGKTPQYVRSIVEGRRHDDAGSGPEDAGQRHEIGATRALTIAEYERLQQEQAS